MTPTEGMDPMDRSNTRELKRSLATVRDALLAEREVLDVRIQAIDAALGGSVAAPKRQWVLEKPTEDPPSKSREQRLSTAWGRYGPAIEKQLDESGFMTQRELAVAGVSSRATISAAVLHGEEQGYIVRHPEDQSETRGVRYGLPRTSENGEGFSFAEEKRLHVGHGEVRRSR